MEKKILFLALTLITVGLIFVSGCVKKSEAQIGVKPTLGEQKTTYGGFKQLKKGDWAEWISRQDGKEIRTKMIYAGDATIDGIAAHGVETHTIINGQESVSQVWFSDSNKLVKYVMKSGDTVICIASAPGDIAQATYYKTPDVYKPESVQNKIAGTGKFTTESGKQVSVFKIKQDSTEVWISSEVPFGIVKTIYNGQVIRELADFGSNAELTISLTEVENCQQLELPFE